MRHYVITRFNAAIDNFRNLKAFKHRLDTDYLDQRMKLFFDYTYPSLKNQSCKDFVWLVCFSDRTPDKYRGMIEDRRAAMPCMTPLYMPDKAGFYTYLNEYVLSDMKAHNETKVISSRIDNDDMFSFDYIAAVQDEMKSSNFNTPCIISFPYGMQYIIEADVFRKYEYVKNHFITYTTDIGRTPLTVMDFNHANADESIIRKLRTSYPMWMECVHDCNIKNHDRGGEIIEEYELRVLKERYNMP